MAKYKPQHLRLLFIDGKVKEGKYPNCSSLAEEYEVSKKTIQRDIEYMRYQLDAPIEYIAKHRGYVYTEEQYQLPAIAIKESDLFGVYLAEKLLVQYEETPVYDSLCSVFKKIADSLPGKMTTDPIAAQTKFTVFPPYSTFIEPEIWNTITGCLRSCKQVKIKYKTPGKEVIPRLLDPYHGVRYEGDWYVVGYCHLRDDIRTFSLSRIEAAETTGETFLIPDDFDFQHFSGSHFGVHWGDGEIKVKLRFSKRVADYVTGRTWHPSQKVSICKNGDVDLSMTVNHLLELKRWVLSWGADVKVVEPDYFANDIEATLRQAMKGYR